MGVTVRSGQVRSGHDEHNEGEGEEDPDDQVFAVGVVAVFFVAVEELKESAWWCSCRGLVVW